jgi:hypothetical protein
VRGEAAAERGHVSGEYWLREIGLRQAAPRRRRRSARQEGDGLRRSADCRRPCVVIVRPLTCGSSDRERSETSGDRSGVVASGHWHWREIRGESADKLTLRTHPFPV